MIFHYTHIFFIFFIHSSSGGHLGCLGIVLLFQPFYLQISVPQIAVKIIPTYSVSQLSTAVGFKYAPVFLSIESTLRIYPFLRDMPHKDDDSGNLLQNVLENLGNVGHLPYWSDTTVLCFQLFNCGEKSHLYPSQILFWWTYN